MYDSFFGFTERPFQTTPQLGAYYPSEQIESAIQTVIGCVERGAGPALVIASTGTGKTTLVLKLQQHFSSSSPVAVLSGTNCRTPRSLLQNALFAVGLPYVDMDEGQMRLSLTEFFKLRAAEGENILLLMDDADSLGTDLLEELLGFSSLTGQNGWCVPMVLIGSFRLEEALGSPQVASLNQRIAARCYIDSWSRSEVEDYVQTRIEKTMETPAEVFLPGSISKIYEVTVGVPRVVNQLCDHALVMAAAKDQRQIDEFSIEEAWADLQRLPLPETHFAAEITHEADDSFDPTASEPVANSESIVEFGSLDDEPQSSAMESYEPIETFAPSEDVDPAHEAQRLQSFANAPLTTEPSADETQPGQDFVAEQSTDLPLPLADATVRNEPAGEVADLSPLAPTQEPNANIVDAPCPLHPIQGVADSPTETTTPVDDVPTYETAFPTNVDNLAPHEDLDAGTVAQASPSDDASDVRSESSGLPDPSTAFSALASAAVIGMSSAEFASQNPPAAAPAATGEPAATDGLQLPIQPSYPEQAEAMELQRPVRSEEAPHSLSQTMGEESVVAESGLGSPTSIPTPSWEQATHPTIEANEIIANEIIANEVTPIEDITTEPIPSPARMTSPEPTFEPPTHETAAEVDAATNGFDPLNSEESVAQPSVPDEPAVPSPVAAAAVTPRPLSELPPLPAPPASLAHLPSEPQQEFQVNPFMEEFADEEVVFERSVNMQAASTSIAQTVQTDEGQILSDVIQLMEQQRTSMDEAEPADDRFAKLEQPTDNEFGPERETVVNETHALEPPLDGDSIDMPPAATLEPTIPQQSDNANLQTPQPMENPMDPPPLKNATETEGSGFASLPLGTPMESTFEPPSNVPSLTAMPLSVSTPIDDAEPVDAGQSLNPAELPTPSLHTHDATLPGTDLPESGASRDEDFESPPMGVPRGQMTPMPDTSQGTGRFEDLFSQLHDEN